jgi:serine/threonine protein kinase
MLRSIKDEMHLEGWDEQEVGPSDFRIVSKLGQGSFGIVYLVEKLNKMPDGTIDNTGNLYAMKILNKK